MAGIGRGLAMRAKSLILVAAAAAFFGAPTATAARRCLTDAQIEAAVGDDVRAGVFALDTSSLPNLPLCSAIPLAHRIQQMREAAFPDERNAREQRAAEQRFAQGRLADQTARARLAAIQRAAELEEAERQAALARARRDAAVADSEARSASTLRARIDANGLSAPSGAQVTAIAGLNERLDRLVAEDSTEWKLNHYVSGSMRRTRAYADPSVPGSFVAMGEFRYTNGSDGWVRARFDGDTLMCLEFSDEPGNCRALYDSLSNRRLLGFGSLVAQIVVPMLPGLIAGR